jgi:hypothetical protein
MIERECQCGERNLYEGEEWCRACYPKQCRRNAMRTMNADEYEALLRKWNAMGLVDPPDRTRTAKDTPR